MPALRSSLFIMSCFSFSASAEIMNPQLPARSIGVGLSTLHVQQPDSNNEQRYRLDLQEYLRLPYGLRLHNRLGIARDTRPRSDSIQVHHHFYELYSGLQWTGVRLFRYGIGAGPLVLIEQTVTRIELGETTSRTYNRLQLGGLVEAQLDYAFNNSWELGLISAFQFRPAVKKQDFSFGVSLQFNWGSPRRDENQKNKAPDPGPPAPYSYRSPALSDNRQE